MMPGLLLKPIPVNIAAITLGLAFSLSTWAAPSGGEIVSGAGNIQTDATSNTTIINQQSSRMGIDWQSFDVQSHETVTFNQPSATASALNRILDEKPSEIFGRINANGRVYLMNPNGILFGESARVNVGALVAGNLDFSQQAFSEGRYEFYANEANSESNVINRGVLTAMPGGSINLLGTHIQNEGTIEADHGQVNLVAGRRVIMNLDDGEILGFSVQEGLVENSLKESAAIENAGEILADGGQIVLDGKLTGEVLNSVINNSGVIRANRIENSGGVIRLVGNGGMIMHTGQIEARGDAASQTGGDVAISADRIGIYDTASIDVSAPHGGGTIAIGNKPPTDNNAPSAQFTQLGRDTRLLANAELDGNGGEIIVWADDSVWAYGSLSAQGGMMGGNGGFAEISGGQGLSFAGQVDLSASQGTLGTLLFDPDDVVIHDQADGAQTNDGDLPDLTSPPSTGTFDIGELALESLAATSNIILEATNDITINSLTTDGVLDLATTNSGSLTITADSDSDGNGSFSMDTGDTLSTQGGAITITGSNITAGIISTDISGVNDGAITLSATASASVTTANAGSESIAITVDSDDDGVESLTIGGVLAGSGGISLQGGSDGSDTLIAPNSNNAWTISSLDSGSLNGAGFSYFTNLTGGSGDDAFVFSGIGSLSGLIDGGADTAGDSVDYTGSSGIVTVIIDTDVTNIETLVGGGSDYTLVGPNAATTWTIASQNDGTVGSINFVDFSNLTGGSGNDSFVLSGGSVTGVITGGSGSDSLTGNNATNNWNILTPNGGTVDGVFSFSGIENLIGGSASDSFGLNGGSIAGTIDGSAGNDSLAADNVVNIWNISGADSGNVTNLGGFVNIENLVGRTDVDSFVFDPSGTISGSIDGGSGIDEVDLSLRTGTISVDLTSGEYTNIESFSGNGANSTLTATSIINTWTLSSANSGTLNGIDFVDFASLVGGSDSDTFILSGGAPGNSMTGGGGDDTIVADISNNTWLVTGTDSGQLNGTTFTDIDNLTGNIGSDVFYFSSGGNVSGAVDGASGSDTVDYTGEAGAVSVDIGNTGFTNIETYIGNNTNSTLIGENTTNDWSITGQNDGVVNTLVFSNFNNLTGNLNSDNFTLNGGSITGTITGGGGMDTITAANAVNTWNITAADTGDVTGIAAFTNIDNLTGNINSDTFNFTTGASISGLVDGGAGSDIADFSSVGGAVSVSLDGGKFANVETYIGNGASSTLIGDNTANTWLIDGVDSGTVNLIDFIDFANLEGNSSTDYFYLSGGSISGSIDGASGTDAIFADDVNNSWTISGTDTGSVTGAGSFTSIERVIGGTASDNYVFSSLGAISNEVNGGSLPLHPV
jgi:fibronectin-binding autotransporter adhesin